MRLTERTQKDFDAIDELNTLAFESMQRANSFALKWAFDNGDVFVHRVFGDKLIVAFAIVIKQNGHPFLWAIATAPAWQKQGIASRLLKEVIDFYDGSKGYMDLTVRSDNPAQKLYFDHGFRVKQVMRGYYRDKIDGLRMRRIL